MLYFPISDPEPTPRPDWEALSLLRERWGSRKDQPACVVLAEAGGTEPWIGLAQWIEAGTVLRLIPQEHGAGVPFVAIDYPREQVGRVEWLAYNRCSTADCLAVLAPGPSRRCPACEARLARDAALRVA